MSPVAKRSGAGRLRLLAPVAVVGVLGLLASCGSDSPDAPAAGGNAAGAATTAAASVPLEGTTWELEATALNLPGGDRIQPTLLLSDGRASGFTGCNRLNTSYTTSGSSLTFGQAAMTNMACPAVETAIEQAYLARLAQVATYELGPSSLVLKDASGATVLTFAAANSSLVGDWTVTGYLTSSGNAFTSVVNGSELTAGFVADGTVNGNTGCNTFRGPWTQGPGDAVTIGPLAATLAACTDPDLSTQETSYLRALESSTTAEVASHEATLFNSAGQRALTLSR